MIERGSPEDLRSFTASKYQNVLTQHLKETLMSNLNNFQATIGIDIAKNVFQVYCVDNVTGEISNKQLTREEMHEYFANRQPCLIGMEACGGSQYWARQLTDQGHTVRLMDPKLVKPFVSHYKSDKADAEGIWIALTHGVRTVTVKGKTERDIQTLLRIRERLVCLQTGNMNHVRGLLLEYGVTIPKSVAKFELMVDKAINDLEGDSVALVIDSLRDIVAQIRDSRKRIDTLTKEIKRLVEQTKYAKYFSSVPGVGVITTAHMCVLLSDPSSFKSARQFAAFLGLVPMHTGSGGKTITTHIPGRCNKALRALMVECAQSVARGRNPEDWVRKILSEKPKKVALIAIANRIARQCWAVASKGQKWRRMPVVGQQ